ncbi:alpha/beta fold hydrolase [Halomonas elongata]|uniref:Alpha/beta hydrolase n=1 Tax=Halomonas elongata (strain ATCC 33173 / DSM 2581 / NBRC 15536 / NCIMB 2198 / 1H9) TaxID=768066 RepID=A0A1R4A4I9_HALED|nr:alpha/beta hydrolase [Halomonas elongata]MBW5801898.1 alpha/beta hydrolase [Halomonas elongata]WBF17736.1 alpha/beta hydrolase [Halomonas elongata]WPU46580.1 alpha/beta hydrolase [Halomonas elongata DSM 2581]WVI71344.1 alpha/beta hydrolase [Halomonas elongata]SJK83881.1 alpha/beta hydrolase fold protein [Halomonas elongata DSM 2581]
MRREVEVVSVGEWNVHVERYLFSGVSESAIFVNGALSTTQAFRNTIKNLKGKVNMILFDLPFIGKSRQYNAISRPMSKTEEVMVLQGLMDRYQPSYLLSVSWGGLAALMALAKKPPSVRKALIASFSTRITPEMHRYIERAKVLLDERKNHEVATLLNDEVGKYLPGLLKRINHEHIKSLDDETYRQARFHIGQVASLSFDDYVDVFKEVEVPVLFVNGDWDEYTSKEDVRCIENYIDECEFFVVPEAGHFLDMESKSASRYMNEIFDRHLLA